MATAALTLKPPGSAAGKQGTVNEFADEIRQAPLRLHNRRAVRHEQVGRGAAKAQQSFTAPPPPNHFTHT